jgi:hypothetical protein
LNTRYAPIEQNWEYSLLLETLMKRHVTAAAVFVCHIPVAVTAQEADLAKQLSNPVASLISVPFQLNYDENIGPDDAGSRILLNIQPVVQISLNASTNLISRTIVPLAWNDDIGGSDDSGIGDIVQSFFFSPKEPTNGGLIWGVGPVFLLPTASDPSLGSEKWGAGITGVALKQSGPWTFGALGNHIRSFAGADDRADINATFLQPFVSYTTPKATTFALNTESTYDWETEQWSVPINATVSQLVSIGNQPVSLTAGVRYWADTPENGPDGLGFRFGATLLFPK